ncbi:GTP-binding protein [Actinophytocola algeriensis]|uniref:G3E family GTPase n=1 Tax=Actinophytocola algeriensis TaxID=1768010 RepID=A0A7W7Q5S4_9PSEU|nr:GTP-binding protein [Actinophytocola algeriensis]MBB4907562.1 G3E family GTPase [Actinophytocola algeriensis]MBE1479592.1 G3E family GTPase [Actinophytocola algeriensis]
MITFVPVSGFLGAGKTTTLLAAARELRARGHRPAIVTNDQGRDLVDTRLARTVTDAVGEVLDGCFCCRFTDLADVTTALVADGADVVLAEAVGSCTDLRATVVRPLREYHGDTLRVAPLTTVVDPLRYRAFARSWAAGHDDDTAYLYAHQVAEADVLALNKVDLLGAGLTPLLSDLGRRNPSARVVPYSARSGSVGRLVDMWLAAGDVEDRADEALDYDRYAAAEAALAWLNHEVTVSGPFSPGRWTRVALASLSRAAAGTLVGHAKVTVETGEGLAKGSVTTAGAAPALDLPGPLSASGGRAVFNLRIA